MHTLTDYILDALADAYNKGRHNHEIEAAVRKGEAAGLLLGIGKSVSTLDPTQGISAIDAKAVCGLYLERYAAIAELPDTDKRDTLITELNSTMSLLVRRLDLSTSRGADHQIVTDILKETIAVLQNTGADITAP